MNAAEPARIGQSVGQACNGDRRRVRGENRSGRKSGFKLSVDGSLELEILGRRLQDHVARGQLGRIVDGRHAFFHGRGDSFAGKVAVLGQFREDPIAGRLAGRRIAIGEDHLEVLFA